MSVYPKPTCAIKVSVLLSYVPIQTIKTLVIPTTFLADNCHTLSSTLVANI